jgi:hypothetical protein
MQGACPDVDLRAEHEKFTDYWLGVAGSRGVKADWPATWRNWMRKAQDQSPRTASARPRLSKRELGIIRAEQMKSNPDPEILRRAGLNIPKELGEGL